jgi:hypothetical protein
MNKSRTMLAMLAMLAPLTTMGTAANAVPFTLGAAGYGGNTQNTVDCILYNAGTSPVSVSGAKIASAFNGSLPLTFNNCVSLAAGNFCTIQANIVNNDISHACKVDVSSLLDVRGSLVIRNVNAKFGTDQVLIDVPLR